MGRVLWMLSMVIISAWLPLALSYTCEDAWGSSSGDRVLLSDVKALTLYSDRMTTGRRSSPVPQLKCVGGSAGCSSFVPLTVQCTNKGTDGVDVQWECKADMDNAYRFGRVEVTCEGYDYPEDPYILRGSCGLEYTLELTKEGYEQQNRHNQYTQQHQHQYQDSSYQSYTRPSKKSSNWFGDLVLLAIVGVVIYALYRTCIAPSVSAGTAGGRPDDNARRGYPSDPPPPYGFRDEYMPGSGGGCSSNMGGSTFTSPRHTPGTGGGGFWTGAATGGLLGYMFGSRTNQGYRHHSPTSSWGSGWGSGWGANTRTHSTPSWGTGSSWGSGGSSTGTRTASGFGGTKRR